MKKMKEYLIQGTWWLGDKHIPITTDLIGIGVAANIHKGIEAIAEGVKFPYQLLIGGSFMKEATEAFFGLGKSMIDYPVATLATLIGSYTIGKITKHILEKKRLQRKYATQHEKKTFEYCLSTHYKAYMLHKERKKIR